MKFGPVPLEMAEGAVLAHSVQVSHGRLRKGVVLAPADIAALKKAGLSDVVVAQLDPGDLSEDDAASHLGRCLGGPGFQVTAAVTGRVNLVAETPGLVRMDTSAIAAMNRVDEGLTLATLPDLSRVEVGQLVATVKVIPYGVPGRLVDAAATALGKGAITHLPFRGGRAQVILTRTPGFKPSLIDKGKDAVTARLATLGYELAEAPVVDHRIEAVADVLDPSQDLVLILGASATSDRGDVVPAAVVRAGGRIERFGMPVDPGNLLFLGRLGETPVVGLPGCARSPALNGVDWVLERIAAGLNVDDAVIAEMGVGGLLKEMPGRPQPRLSKG